LRKKKKPVAKGAGGPRSRRGEGGERDTEKKKKSWALRRREGGETVSEKGKNVRFPHDERKGGKEGRKRRSAHIGKKKTHSRTKQKFKVFEGETQVRNRNEGGKNKPRLKKSALDPRREPTPASEEGKAPGEKENPARIRKKRKKERDRPPFENQKKVSVFPCDQKVVRGKNRRYWFCIKKKKKKGVKQSTLTPKRESYPGIQMSSRKERGRNPKSTSAYRKKKRKSERHRRIV